MKTFEDVYKFPLKDSFVEHDGWRSKRIIDQKDQFVFEFISNVTDETQINILNTINGEITRTNKNISFFHEDGNIFVNHEENNIDKLILIRGWGNLTGIGGHNFSGEVAANIQDTFADFIVDQLNKTK